LPVEGANWLLALGYSPADVSQLGMLADQQDYTYRFSFANGVVQAIALKNRGVITLTGGVRAPFDRVGISNRRVADHLEIFNRGGAPSLTATEVLTREEAIQAGILIPGEEEPEETTPTPTVEEKAFFRIFSTPSGGRVFIDNIDTGQNTMTAPIEVVPGMRKIEVKALEGFADTQVTRLARVGETRDIRIPLAALADKPTEEPGPVETSPREQFKSPLTQIVNALGLETPGFLAAWDEFIGTVTDIFGTSFPQFVIDETTGEFKRLPNDKKILFFVSMTAPINAGEKALQAAIESITAEEFLALAAKDPKAALAILKPLSPAQLGQFYTSLGKGILQRDAIQTSTRLILDAAGKNLPLSAKLIAALPSAKNIGLMVAGIAAIASWGSMDNLLFALNGGIAGLIQQGAAKEAIERIKASKETMLILFENPIWRGMANIFTAGIWQQAYEAEFLRLEDLEIQARNKLEATEVGEIAVTTDPARAVITVNGTLHTFPSPTVVSKLPPGKYTVKLELDGHIDHEELVNVKAQEQAKIEHTFSVLPGEITARAGRLEITIFDKKTGASLIGSFFINDRLEKEVSHALALDLIPGPVEIRIEAFGYKTWEDVQVVDLDTTTKVIAELDKFIIQVPELPPEAPSLGEEPPTEPKTGRLEVNSNTTANILIGGVDTGKKTPSGFNLSQGIYSVTLEAEGFISRGTTTLIKTGETSTVSLELTAVDVPPPTRRLAKVSIQSEPSSAKILVNGVWTKQYTPDSVLLEAGDYEITLTKSGFQTWRTPLRLVEES